MRTIQFIHMTDLHVLHPDLEDRQAPLGTVTTLLDVIAAVNRIDPPPSFVAISGDLVDRGDVSSYRLLRQLLSGLKIPVLYALGNHDDRAGFYVGMLGSNQNPESPYCHEQVVHGVHVVVLDTSVKGRIGGALSESQFLFLTSALTRHDELPKILLMHHAPRLGADAGYAWESLSESDTDRLASIVRDKKVAGILTGHIHYDRVSVWQGIPVVVTTGHQNAVDPTFQNGLRKLAGGSFAFCALRDMNLTVSFLPLPSDRRELRIVPDERLRSYL